jgi:phage shock protein PspC (stress-responsive transcriptional regulator)
MKKNISINISGIIFHIEEDGYEVLRKYLDSINRYFSSFEDSSEILADIESRIAEILLTKLSEGKQVVTAEDIHSLMATMGSVNDFKAAEEQDFAASEPRTEEKKSEPRSSSRSAGDKKLYRDEKRKVLGGVCAGLAHYFNIDPVWPRVILALLFFASYGGLFVAYVIFWIVLPASSTLEDEPSVRKMFRDTEKKVVGGVAAGVAAYFGADVTLIRVLFVVFTFLGGLGLGLYIILWIALPQAKTITEKIQMQGEPVTLSNIESSVKKGLNEKDDAEESVIAKIVLFPFRLLAAFIEGFGKIFGPVLLVLVDVFRIGIGIVIAVAGWCFILSILFIFGVALGMFHVPAGPMMNDWYLTAPNFPIEAFRQSFSSWFFAFCFIAAMVPALFVALIGSSIIAKRIVFTSYVGWSLFVIFFVSVAFLSVNIPRMVMAFKEEGEHKVELTYNVQGTPVLRLNETGLDDYEVTDLWIRGHEGSDIRLVQRFGAQGSTRKVAIDNAQMVSYHVAQKDSVLLFDSNITFAPDAKFRAQRLDMELYIPFKRPFIIEEDLWRLIDNRADGEYYPDSDRDQTWMLNEFGMLECVTCYNRTEREDRIGERRVGATDEFGFQNFNGIDLEGIFDVRIQKGDTYAVEIDAPSGDRRRYDVYQDGETLVIDFEDDRSYFWKRNLIDEHEIEVNITMPSLVELNVRGAGKVNFRGFDEGEVKIKLTGAVTAKGEMDARSLAVDLTGASYLDLSGEGNFMDADLTGASGLRAYGYEVKHAIIEARGASSAKVHVTERLETRKGMASSISHRGDPDEITENN